MARLMFDSRGVTDGTDELAERGGFAVWGRKTLGGHEFIQASRNVCVCVCI